MKLSTSFGTFSSQAEMCRELLALSEGSIGPFTIYLNRRIMPLSVCLERGEFLLRPRNRQCMEVRIRPTPETIVALAQFFAPSTMTLGIDYASIPQIVSDLRSSSTQTDIERVLELAVITIAKRWTSIGGDESDCFNIVTDRFDRLLHIAFSSPDDPENRAIMQRVNANGVYNKLGLKLNLASGSLKIADYLESKVSVKDNGDESDVFSSSSTRRADVLARPNRVSLDTTITIQPWFVENQQDLEAMVAKAFLDHELVAEEVKKKRLKELAKD